MPDLFQPACRFRLFLARLRRNATPWTGLQWNYFVILIKRQNNPTFEGPCSLSNFPAVQISNRFGRKDADAPDGSVDANLKPDSNIYLNKSESIKHNNAKLLLMWRKGTPINRGGAVAYTHDLWNV